MLKKLLFALLFVCGVADAQVGSTASTCIWNGSLADCLPSTGILLRDNRVIRFSEAVGNGTNFVALTAPAALAADRTATFPDATGNVVIDSATQTLTNKTIDSSSNTISNIVNGNISSSAAIVGSKLVAADGSVAGALTATTQTIGGDKTFTGNLNLQNSTFILGNIQTAQNDNVGSSTGTLDISLGLNNGFAGLLIVRSNRANTTTQWSTKIYHVAGRTGANFTASLLSSVDGASAMTFTITNPSLNVVRFTNTVGSPAVVSMVFIGAFGT